MKSWAIQIGRRYSQYTEPTKNQIQEYKKSFKSVKTTQLNNRQNNWTYTLHKRYQKGQ